MTCGEVIISSLCRRMFRSLIVRFSHFFNDAPSDNLVYLYIAFLYATHLGEFAGVSGPTYSQPVTKCVDFPGAEQYPGSA